MRGLVVLAGLVVVVATLSAVAPTTGSASASAVPPMDGSDSAETHADASETGLRPEPSEVNSERTACSTRLESGTTTTAAGERSNTSAIQSDPDPSLSVRLAYTETAPRSPLALRRAVFTDRFDRGGQVATGTTFVITLTSRTLAAQVESREGNATERFFAVIDGRDTPVVALIEQNPARQRDPDVVAFGPANTTVVRDGPRTYLLVNTSRLEFGDGVGTPREGSTYTVRFGYGDRETNSRPARLFAQPAELPEFRSYDPLPPERVRLPASVFVPPEDGVFFRLTLPNRTITAPVEIAADQRPGADLDLRDVPPGTPYTLTLIHDNRTVTGIDGVIREPDAAIRNVTVERRGDQLVVNATVRLSHGGALRVRDETGDVIVRQPFGPVFGLTTEPNETARVTLRTFETDVERVTIEALREPGAIRSRYENATVTVNVSQSADRLAPTARSRFIRSGRRVTDDDPRHANGVTPYHVNRASHRRAN